MSPTGADQAAAGANESFLIARMSTVQYCLRRGAKCTYALGNEQFNKGETERVVTVDVAYIAMHSPLIAARLKHGGCGWRTC